MLFTRGYYELYEGGGGAQSDEERHLQRPEVGDLPAPIEDSRRPSMPTEPIADESSLMYMEKYRYD